jgi:hypothetical protein
MYLLMFQFKSTEAHNIDFLCRCFEALPCSPFQLIFRKKKSGVIRNLLEDFATFLPSNST